MTLNVPLANGYYKELLLLQGLITFSLLVFRKPYTTYYDHGPAVE